MVAPRKILIIQTAFLGDVILATPVLEKLHRFFPNATIHMLVRKGNEALFKGHPFLNEVICWDKKKNKLAGLFQLIRRIRGERYDLVVNLQRFFSTGLLTLLSGSEERVGFDKNPLAFATRSFPHTIGDGKHEVSRNLSLIEWLTDTSFQMPCLYPDAEDYQVFTPSKPYVCIAPASVWNTKQWPVEKWAALIRLLPAETTVYLIGGPADKSVGDGVLQLTGKDNVHNICGQLTLLASAALMQGAQMNYVNDSGPMHLASSVNAPVTAIFCSTIPAFGFTPLSAKSRVVEVTEKLGCRPCGLHGFAKCPEGHFRCADIPALQVLGVVKEG